MHLINSLRTYMRNQRKGVILSTSGAYGQKTFVQGLLSDCTLSINYITCNISKKQEREGGRRAWRAVGIVRVALFCIFCKTVNSAVPYS